MDHMDHDMHMTSTASGPMASGTGMAMDHDMDGGGMDHSGHGMDMGANGNACKISMLWNWETIDACFIDSSWQISSKGMFAGCCIGVICLVITLEFLRRVGREYDAYILRRHSIRQQIQANPDTDNRNNNNNESSSSSSSPAPKPATAATTNATPLPDSTAANNSSLLSILTGGNTGNDGRVRPSLFDQLVRALLHMMQFAVAYFIMLLAMYYNGYFIICIFIGAFIGSFIFAWEPLGAGKEIDACAVTKCCG